MYKSMNLTEQLRGNASLVMAHSACVRSTDSSLVSCAFAGGTLFVDGFSMASRLSRVPNPMSLSRLGGAGGVWRVAVQYFESKDVDASKSIKQRILDALGGLQFKKNNFNDDNVSTIKSYVYWQVQRALLCKANYLFRAVSESCMPCYCYILCTEVINRAVLSFGSMGILVSIFLLRASDEVRAMRPLLFVNGILSPCLALNALMTAALCLYELYGLGVHFPDLFYDKRFARAIERAKFLFQFLGFKEHFATRK